MRVSSTNWWAAVWRGLVVDPEATHVRQLDGAIWLLLYYILHADRETGTLFTRASTIARHMGVPKRTIQRWRRILLGKGYVAHVETEKRGADAVLRWKSARTHATDGTASRHGWRKVRHGWHTPGSHEGRNSEHLRGESAKRRRRNKIEQQD